MFFSITFFNVRSWRKQTPLGSVAFISWCCRHLVCAQWFYTHYTWKCLPFPDESNYAIAPSPPFDSISSIRYSPTNPHQLLVSAWDAVRLSLFSVLRMQKASYFLLLVSFFHSRLWDSMRLTMVGVINRKPRPSSTIVRPFSHVRSLPMLHMPSVVDWILLSKSTFVLRFLV